MTVSSPATIQDSDFKLAPNHSGSSNKVLKKSQLVLDFALPVPLQTGCLIKVRIPEDFTDVYQSVKHVYASGMFGYRRSLPFTVQSQGLIEIRDACLSYTQNLVIASITISHVVNPSSCRDTEPLIISVYDKIGNLLAKTGSASGIQASEFEPAELNSLSFSASNPTVQESSSLQVQIQATNKLSENAAIEIQLPNEFSLSQNCRAETLTVQTMRSEFDCAVRPGFSSLLVTKLFYNYGYDPNVDQKIVINLIDIVDRNPQSVLPELTFSVTTYDLFGGQYSPVDQLELKVKDFNKAGSLKDVSVSFDSSVSNQYPTEATVRLAINHPPNSRQSTLRVNFPEDFRLAESQVTIQASKGFSAVSPSFTMIDSNTVEIQNDSSLTSGSELVFKVSAIQMPRYQGNGQNQINVQVRDRNTGYLIDEADASYFIQEASEWDELRLGLSNSSNSAPSLAMIKFDKSKTRILLQPGDYFVFTLPAEVKVDSDTLNCRIKDVSYPCRHARNDHAIIVHDFVERPTTISALGNYIAIDGLLNPPSTRPLTRMTFNLKDSKSRVVIKGSDFVWKTTEPAPLAVRLEQVSTKPLQAAPYIFKPVADNGTFSSSFVKITFPECMSFSLDAQNQLKVQDAEGIALEVTFQGGIELRVHDRQNFIKEIVLKDIINPTELCLLQSENTISLQTYEDEAFKQIQGIYTVEPSLGCDPTCLSCLQTDKSTCVQCTADHFLTMEQKCTRTCALGFFADQTSQSCIQCNSDCEACADSPDQCLSCKDPEMLLSEKGLCYKVPICPDHQFLTTENTCEDCSSECGLCTGPEPDQCISCKDDQILVQGYCVQECPTDLSLLSSTYLETCEEKRNQSTLLMVIESLFMDFKFSYSLVALILILIVLKITCLRKMSLLVAMVVTAANFETIAIYALIYQVYSNKNEQYLQPFESYVFYGCPVLFAAITLILNICVTARYLKAIKSQVADSEEEKETYIKWSGKVFTCPRITCFTGSVLLSFQNTAWLNIRAQLPLTMKRRLFFHRFTEDYARASKLSNKLPRLLIQLYSIYYGIFYAFNRLQIRDNLVAVLDLGLVSFILMTLMLMALNFQWSSRALIKKALDSEENQIESKGLFRARNSIALHNLRLSDKDKEDLEAQKKSFAQSNEDHARMPTVIHNAASAKRFFEVERLILSRKNRSLVSGSPANRLQPKLIQNNAEPESPVLLENNLDFSFLKTVKRSILQKMRTNDSSSTNQTIKTTRVKKTRPVQSGQVPSKHKSLDLLSPKRLALFHSQIDDRIQTGKMGHPCKPKEVIDIELSSIEESGPSETQIVRDFTADESADKTIMIDTSAYTSNDQFISPSVIAVDSVERQDTVKLSKESVLLTSKFAVKARKARSVLVAQKR